MSVAHDADSHVRPVEVDADRDLAVRPGSPIDVVGIVVEELRQQKQLSDQSVARLEDLIAGFVSYVQRGCRLSSLREVRPQHAAGFIHATVGGPPGAHSPSTATMHLRRSALRLLFRTARQLCLADSDPTLDLRLPPRSSLRQRPLTDDEIALCRSFALSTLTETRQPAAWAIAEGTGRSAEIPFVRVSNVELENGKVWLQGGSKTMPRWGDLTGWGRQQLLRRLRALARPGDPDPRLVYSGRGSPESRQASSCAAISQVLVRAGLSRELDIGPGSVAAWTGRRLFDQGIPIDEVAARLGVRSLDRAARIIGLGLAG
jgi:hypothetical protein